MASTIPPPVARRRSSGVSSIPSTVQRLCAPPDAQFPRSSSTRPDETPFVATSMYRHRFPVDSQAMSSVRTTSLIEGFARATTRSARFDTSTMRGGGGVGGDGIDDEMLSNPGEGTGEAESSLGEDGDHKGGGGCSGGGGGRWRGGGGRSASCCDVIAHERRIRVDTRSSSAVAAAAPPPSPLPLVKLSLFSHSSGTHLASAT